MSKIVVVEDQQVLATLYRNKFVSEGFEVEVASDGEAGVALINRTRPDLVILDVMLPKLNGIEVLKQIRANPLFSDLPVIIFSNASTPGTVEKAWQAGATMVLSKLSHSPKQIVESVRSALKTAGGQPKKATVALNELEPPLDISVTWQTGSTPGHVLLVEDHPDVQAFLSFLLDQAGHQVTSVASHAGALRQARLQEFDVFLLNRVCPDGLGLTLCRQLRQSFPQQPIVMYSTAALAAEQRAGLDAGAKAYLTESREILNIGDFLSDLMKTLKPLAGLAGKTPVAVPRLAA